MAEQRRSRSGGATTSRSSSRSSRSNAKGISAAEAVRTAREQIEQLMGRSAEAVSSFARDDSKGWVVALEVVELDRIPPSTSLLGTYEARLDETGELVEFRRVRRYARNQVDSQEER
jgi:Gas vesicle synthesis protein GvpO